MTSCATAVPIVDVTAGGSVQGMIAACEKVAAVLPAEVKVIPGHGQIATLSDVRHYATMLKETSAAVQAALKSGKSVDQMKKDEILSACLPMDFHPQ